MTAQQLRNSILQQAIQGRLVPQDPNDEPASVLLERIRKEKEQLVKEGKLKKKDLVIYSLPDNLPFDLPDSWEWVSLSEIVAIPIKRGKSPVYVSNSEKLFIDTIYNNLSIVNSSENKISSVIKICKIDEFMNKKNIVAHKI